MKNQHPNDPLHGITLKKILTELVEYYGWSKLGRIITIRCFNNEPSIKSSLQFLRKTPWARNKVENLYLRYRKHYRTTRSKTEEETGSATEIGQSGAAKTGSLDAQ
jgi:uncharacterized protein (DUF2132 family)